VKLRGLISTSLKAGCFLLFLLVVSAVLWGILAGSGDSPGAESAKVVTIITGICWAIDLVVLIVLLSVAAMRLLEQAEQVEEE